MIQHFLEERFHKAVRFFTGIKTKDIDAIGNVKVTGSLSLNGDAVARPYKVYTALLTQTGTNAPVATVLENTIGDIAWSREGAGSYKATLAGAFTVGQTFMEISRIGSISDVTQNIVLREAEVNVSNNYLLLYQYSINTDGETYIPVPTGLGDGLVNVPIEIRVYE